MKLLPGFAERIAVLPDQGRTSTVAPTLRPLPLDLPRTAEKIHVVHDQASADRFRGILASVQISAIALDSEYQFARPTLTLRGGAEWADIRSQKPICFSLAAWCRSPRDPDSPAYIVRAVLDVRAHPARDAIAETLRLRCPFVFHHTKVDLFSLWAAGINVEIPSLYDTYLAAACLSLGSHHRRSTRGDFRTSAESEEIESEALLGREKAHLLSLAGQCEQYGLAYPFAGEKDGLRGAFLDLDPGDPLSHRQIEYSAADAEWTLRLYLTQQSDVLRAGIHAHLHSVEFPFAVANARIEWNGVHVDPKGREKLRAAAANAADHYAAELRAWEIDPPGSRDRFLSKMRADGLAHHFTRAGKPCTQDDLLEELEELHPAVHAFRNHQRYRRLASEEWLSGMLVGADGRIHPNHRQLGAATGRNSCSAPNIAGIGRVFRPVVTAPPGRAIFEADYSQVEVGVAAAEYGDPDLVAACNSGDVYAAMAKRFFADRLSPDDLALDHGEFKRRHPDLRDRMKTLVLAVIYGIGPRSLALRFGVTERAAANEIESFLALFPALRRRLEEAVAHGGIRREASVVSGLRRRLDGRGRPDGWTRNVLRNTPIQGSAAVVFKRAVVAIDRALRGADSFIVLPVHDAVVVECPADQVEGVAARVKQLMEDALRSYYPQLAPKVDVNMSSPWCWNKDGHADSLDRFLADPTFRIDAPTPTTGEHCDEPPSAFVAERLLEFPPREDEHGDQAANGVDPSHRADPELEAEIERILVGRGTRRSQPDFDARSCFGDFEERAAILEFDAGMARADAEAAARREVLDRLVGHLDACGLQQGGGCHG